MSCCQTSVCTQAFGGEQLLQLLKNYSRSAGLKTSITVGVVGYPNVGTPRRQLRFLVFRLALRGRTPRYSTAYGGTLRYSLYSNPLVFTRCSDDAAPTVFQP